MGERAAAAWLRARGYEILAHNVRTRYGEIDLVARDGEIVVFAEVKSRSGTRCGHPLEAVDGRKRRRLARLAAAFLQARGLDGAATRFDAVAVSIGPIGEVELIDHVPNAFEIAV
jgi:putative endonuclease